MEKPAKCILLSKKIIELPLCGIVQIKGKRHIRLTNHNQGNEFQTGCPA